MVKVLNCIVYVTYMEQIIYSIAYDKIRGNIYENGDTSLGNIVCQIIRNGWGNIKYLYLKKGVDVIKIPYIEMNGKKYGMVRIHLFDKQTYNELFDIIFIFDIDKIGNIDVFVSQVFKKYDIVYDNENLVISSVD